MIIRLTPTSNNKRLNRALSFVPHYGLNNITRWLKLVMLQSSISPSKVTEILREYTLICNGQFELNNIETFAVTYKQRRQVCSSFT